MLTTGLRVRGRTLRIPRWARVTYRVGGRPVASARRRPFRARIAPGVLRPGTNAVSVTVRPRRRPARTTTFGVRVAPVRDGCVVR